MQDLTLILSLTFHSRVKAAQEFASDTSHGIGRYLNGYDVRHVHGKQRSSERKALIDAFRHAEKGVLTNARCLTEGVDVPAVDMVAFIDPKQSRIDIAQATGRAMRKPQGASTKTVGYVVVPLFAADCKQKSLDEAIESESFDQVADVLNALQEQDEDLLDIIRELRELKGAGKPFDLRRLRQKVKVIGPAVNLEHLNTSISIAFADRIGIGWDEWYGRLKAYKQREGDCLVPTSHLEQGYRLGSWVDKQRQNKDTLLPERHQRLDALGFIWNKFAASWEEGFRSLEIFRRREGHCRVPQRHREQGYRLGLWVANQRAAQDIMLPERRQRLDVLGFVWDRHADWWEEGVRCLECYRKVHGDCLMSHRYRDLISGYRLGSWVTNQRTAQDTMPPERRQRLDALGFVWDTRIVQWEEGFRSLEIFRQREGHCRVPQLHHEQGFRLGQWVGVQRTTRDVLSPDRRARLDALGFVWDARTAQWEEGCRYLEIFHQREGHCLVPTNHREQGYPLGSWVSHQRDNKESMSPDRRQWFDALGFVWNKFAASWEEGFRYLQLFHQREGHCRVPTSHREQGFRLGQWVGVQRIAHDKLSPDRRQRLDVLGFVWDARTAQWEEGFRYLEIFRQRDGHCRVPKSHLEQGYRLGQWAGVQRMAQDTMSPERRQRLEALGFVWKVR